MLYILYVVMVYFFASILNIFNFEDSKIMEILLLCKLIIANLPNDKNASIYFNEIDIHMVDKELILVFF